MQNDPHNAVALHGARLIDILASDEAHKNKSVIRKLGGLEPMVRLLRQAETPELCLATASGVGHICWGDPGTSRHLVKGHGITALCKMIRPGVDPLVTTAALWALRTAAASPAVVMDLIAAEQVGRLPIPTPSPPPPLLFPSGLIMRPVPLIRHSLFRQGIKQTIRILGLGESSDMATHAAFVLSQFAMEKRFHAEIIERNGAEPAVSLLKYNTVRDEQATGLQRGRRRLATCPPPTTTASSAPAPPPLRLPIPFARRSSLGHPLPWQTNYELKTYLVREICGLAGSVTGREAIRRAGGVSVLVNVLERDCVPDGLHTDIGILTSEALWHCSYDKVAGRDRAIRRPRLLPCWPSTPGLRPLLIAAPPLPTPVQLNVLRMKDAQLIPMLVKLAQQDPDKIASFHMLNTISIMSELDACHQELFEAGAVSCLIMMAGAVSAHKVREAAPLGRHGPSIRRPSCSPGDQSVSKRQGAVSGCGAVLFHAVNPSAAGRMGWAARRPTKSRKRAPEGHSAGARNHLALCRSRVLPCVSSSP